MQVADFEVTAAVRARFPEFFAEHVRGGVYFNPWNDREMPGFGEMLKWQTSRNPWKDEKGSEKPVACRRDGLDAFRASSAARKVLWLGHASFLLELDGVRFLVDPVVGRVGAFVTRFAPEPYDVGELPSVDAVFLTHGHYDHLDVQTLRAVASANPSAQFVVPVGQARYLPRGCEVTELDWWQKVEVGGVEAIFVPAQHWHRRGAFDQNRALWGGWVWRGSSTMYHTGDTGYCGIFEVLSELFEVDVAMLPVGAFEPRWFMRTQHMNPADAWRGYEELGAPTFVPMHWGTYDLTDEPLNLGVELIVQLAEEAGRSDELRVLAPGQFLVEDVRQTSAD